MASTAQDPERPGSGFQGRGKEVLSSLRQLLQRTKDSKHTVVAANGDAQLKELIQKADELHSKVEKPREQAVDAEVMQTLAEYGVTYVNNLAAGTRTCSATDLLRKLKAMYVRDTTDAQQAGAEDPGAFDWSSLGWAVGRYFAPVPTTHHMLGPLDAVPKQRRAVQRQKRRAEVGDAVRPEELGDQQLGEDRDKQETDRNMEVMFRLLRGQPGGRANLLELVLDHASFAQTVENVFTLSFLVKEGRVELAEDPGGGGVDVRLLPPPAKGAPKPKEGERLQFVILLDIAVWEDWKRVTDPAACLSEHRADRPDDQPAPGGSGSDEDSEEEEEEEEEEEGEPHAEPPRKRRR